ncbi:ornithine cyclodeaminase [soil metagenome]
MQIMGGAMTCIDVRDVERLLTPAACIALVRQAMAALSDHVTLQQPRSILDLANGKFGLMAGALSIDGFFGAKLISIFDDPASPGHRTHRGVIILFDPAEGVPVCLVDAEEITVIRTAAASAVATDALARSDARSLAIFGTGRQAQAHVHAIACVRDLQRVTIWGRSLQKAEALAETLRGETGLDVVAEASAQAAARADILCTVTTAAMPVLLSDWVLPGTHVNMVGSSRPGPVEVDEALVLRGRYVADSRAQVLLEAAEFLSARAAGKIGDEHIVAEIGEVLLGRIVGRRDDQEVTLYKSLGHPVQDLAAVAFLYQAIRSESAR